MRLVPLLRVSQCEQDLPFLASPALAEFAVPSGLGALVGQMLPPAANLTGSAAGTGRRGHLSIMAMSGSWVVLAVMGDTDLLSARLIALVRPPWIQAGHPTAAAKSTLMWRVHLVPRGGSRAAPFAAHPRLGRRPHRPQRRRRAVRRRLGHSPRGHPVRAGGAFGHCRRHSRPYPAGDECCDVLAGQRRRACHACLLL